MYKGEYNTAREYCEEVLDVQKEILGDEHIDTLFSYILRDAILRNSGIHDDSDDYNTPEGARLKTIEYLRRTKGEKHMETLREYVSYGRYLLKQENYKDAEIHFNRALKGLEEQYPENNRAILFSIYTLIDLYEEWDKQEEAEKYLIKYINTYLEIIGKPGLNVSELRSIRGDMVSTGKLDEAEVYLLEALENRRRVLGNEHPDTLYSINALAELYDAWDKPEEAKKYREMLPAEEEESTQ